MSSLSIKHIIGLFIITTSVSACLGAQEIERREKEDALVALNKATTLPVEFTSKVVAIGGCMRYQYQQSDCAVEIYNNGQRIKAYMVGPLVGDQVICRNGVAWLKYDKYLAKSAHYDGFWMGRHSKITCIVNE